MLSIVIDVDIRHDSVQFSKNIRFLSPKRQDLIYHVSLLVAIHIFFQFINHSFSVSSGTEGRGRTDTPCGTRFLSRARLPIPPLRHLN